MDSLRPSFRCHRRPRPFGRPYFGRTIRLPSWNVVDTLGRGAGWRRAGFHYSFLLHSPGWQNARPDGARRDWPGGRICLAHYRAADHDHSSRGCGAGRRECSEGQSLGNVHHYHDDSHRCLHGALSALPSTRQGSGMFGIRIRSSAGQYLWRKTGGRITCGLTLVYLERHRSGHRHRSVRFSGQRFARVAAAGAPRLSQYVHQAGRNFLTRTGNCGHPPRAGPSSAYTLHRWHRSHFRRQSFPILLYHHCLRRDFGFSFPYIVGHHAQDDLPRMARVAHWLRLHAAGRISLPSWL